MSKPSFLTRREITVFDFSLAMCFISLIMFAVFIVLLHTDTNKPNQEAKPQPEASR